jgi:predicted helicase
MSKVLINKYYQNLERAMTYGKSTNEMSIRNHFWTLLNEYAHDYNYEVVPEVKVLGTKGKAVTPDGVVRNLWGLDVGLWESKDEKDDLDSEIDSKVKKGYPLTNILFEDSRQAVLFQRGEELVRIDMRDPDKLHGILLTFITFKSEVVYKFEDAIEKFKADIPAIVEALRASIVKNRENNPKFIAAQETFFELCKAEINPDITLDDIREMMIQHILTGDIFNKIFDDPDFHRHNTIASELEKLIETLYTYQDRRNLLHSIEHYYEAINATAAAITDHHEKQKFLKVLYENFYKVYNPKAADRLGVVYTPNEIVQFMVKSTDYLLHKHFGKTLADKNVDILDPATGTGTFICEIMEHAIPSQNLKYKYDNELHANEVAILPYYIANLNIEYTFKQKMQYYAEFNNLCFVDTLDNVAALHYEGKENDLFGLTSENTKRIKKQNSKKISVVIGNPPYNANQLNENENNKNRTYPEIDKRIKETFIKNSSAQKSKMYDMYARFYRWAMDRLDKNGILAFITNRSYIDSRTFDGFRKYIQDSFYTCYIIDLGGDIRAHMGSGEKIGNVFGIITGVSIMFLIKKEKQVNNCIIEYVKIDDSLKKEEKLKWLKQCDIDKMFFERIIPDKNNNWINAEENDFESLVPLIGNKNQNAVFFEISNGVSTNRDEWVYDYNVNKLRKKIKYFIDEYNSFVEKWRIEVKKMKYSSKKSDELMIIANKFVFNNNPTIKWSSRLFRDKLIKEKTSEYDESAVSSCLYRPFNKRMLNYDYITIDLKGEFSKYISKTKNDNYILSFSGLGSTQSFQTLVTNTLTSLDCLEKTKCIPLYVFNNQNNRLENITDWGLDQFVTHYKDKTISKEDIFNYTYAVLHDPAYRKKYELNLKREFPRLPFYSDFWKWAGWGKKLMELHINYEKVEPYKLEIIESGTKAESKRQKEFFSMVKEPETLYGYKPSVKAKLRADKETGIIEIDNLTFLKGVPKSAWDYKLGNRSALEWVLDQYKEKKPSDPTIAEKFNTYRFADYKDHVIDLLKRVCTVSVETVRIVESMGKGKIDN